MRVKTQLFGVYDLIDYMVFRDYQKIFSQLSLLVLMFLLAVSLPMVTRLVQQSQETRSRATEEMTTNLNFKIAFKGIKPGYINNSTGTYNCFDQLGKLTTEIVNTTTNTYESVSNTSLEPIANQTNDDGDQVFKVVIPVSSTKFSNVNNLNYLRIKSNFSLASRMCQNNQTTKLDEASTCNISLNDSATVYDFSDYSLTPGDINQDGVVNSADYSSLKNNLNPDDDITCGKTGDLNFDGMVNSLDSSLIKEALSYQSDGLVLRPNQTITSIPTKTLTPTPTNKLTNTPTLTKTLTPTKTPTLTPTTTSVLTGTPYSSNSTSCQNQKGICTTYSKALSDDTACKVSGYSAIGNVKTGLCPGSTKVVCCTNITTSTLTPSPTKTVTPTMAQVGSGSLKFAVMSDLHDNNTGLKRMLQRAKDDNVSFVVMSGDLTNGGTTTQLKASKKILDGSGVRYIAIPGNHDIYRGMFDDIFGITYQSIRMGGVKLILINNSNDRGLGDEQKIWLESEVVECKTVICMAIMHMPLNHPTSKHIMGEDRSTTAEQAKWLRQLLISNKVKAIAAGHIHHFAEYTLEGIHTFLVGAGTNSDFSEFTIDSNGNVFREKINL